jgi:hypothetical protein
MLDLRSPRWKELSHAYGSAEDIPGLLSQLKTAAPKKDYRSEPWFSLWSALCHQGDVYTASYAGVPRIVAIRPKRPISERTAFLLIAAKIEATRHAKRAPRMPADLRRSYEDAIRAGVLLAMSCMEQDWQEDDYRVILGALTIFLGHLALGNMLLEFDGDSQCPNCDTVFPPLGYDILKEK